MAHIINTAQAYQEGGLRNLGPKIDGRAGINIEINWHMEIPTNQVLADFDAAAAAVRKQIEAHDEQ